MTSRKDMWLGILLSGMSLGTAWAIRGNFGHEQGAAWAGGIGALALVLLSRSTAWNAKFIKITFASAAGWGVGGIMSYGMVVGYGKSVDFGNTFYGLAMLLLIGGLYGFTGGGLFALALADNDRAKVKWPVLIVEMIAGALLFYYFIILSFEWLMTPPRSEAWAACLGMAAALLWFQVRNRQYAALRVAVFSALGAGFGFAFGNFLQVMGIALSVQELNLWNVMEYSIGFFGGCGMAYGVYTSRWDDKTPNPGKQTIVVPLLTVALIIPLIVWDQSFTIKRLTETTPEAELDTLKIIQWSAAGIIILYALYAFKTYYLDYRNRADGYSFNKLFGFFVALFVLYLLFHLLISGAFFHGLKPEQWLYLLSLAGILIFIPRVQPVFLPRGQHTVKWLALLAGIIFVLALLALIATNLHGPLTGAKERF